MQHLQNLSKPWAPFLPDINLIDRLSEISGSLGGTRPTWVVTQGGETIMLMAWPQVSLLRVGNIVGGPEEGPLRPLAVIPIMEGFANKLTIEDTFAWQGGYLGEALAFYDPEASPICFFDPLFYRDSLVDLSPGATQLVILSGLCYGIRKAMMDEIIVTRGPNYEAHATKWLEENPGKTRLDVPVLKIPIAGANVMMPGEVYCEYQARCRIYDVDELMFGPPGLESKVYCFGVSLGSQNTALNIIMYAPASVCDKGYVPKSDDEVDLLFWLQGRVADLGEDVDGPDEDEAGDAGQQ